MNKNIYSKAIEHLKTSPDFTRKAMYLLKNSAKTKRPLTKWLPITVATVFIFAISVTVYTIFLKQAADITEPSGNELNIENAVYIANKLIDYFNDDEMPWNGSQDFKLLEFPDTVFRWSPYNVTATDSNGEKELYVGMPVWSIYLADLTGDGLPEICSTVSMGSGIIDEHILVYDYAQEKTYELSDRMYYDYNLFLDNDQLMVKQVKYLDSFDGDEFAVGELAIVDGQLTANGIDRTKYNADEVDENQFYELTFNEMPELRTISPISKDFSYWLTFEEIELLFPILKDFSNLEATVDYNNEELIGISIYGNKRIESPENKFNYNNVSIVIDFTGYYAEHLNNYRKRIESYVFGVSVIASLNDTGTYCAIFEIDGVLYNIDSSFTSNEFTRFINDFIKTLKQDFDIHANPYIPESPEAGLTLNEAYESMYGKFIPRSIPERYNFLSADRCIVFTFIGDGFIGVENKVINLFWNDGFYSVSCSVSEFPFSFNDLEENNDSINFLPYNITIDAIQEVLDRPVAFADIKDAEGNSVCGESLKSFKVLYGDILVDISVQSSGITAEEIYEMLVSVG